MHLLHRQAKNCDKGKQLYTCNSGPSGCCSAEECARYGCSDYNPALSSTTKIQNSENTSLRSTITSSSSIPTSISPSFFTTASPSSAVGTRQVTSVASATATSQPAEANVSGSSSLPVPIIAGSVVGAVGFAVIAALLWMCLRRRRIKKSSAGSPTGGFAAGMNQNPLDASPDEEQHLRPNDGFAPFGGYQRSPSMQDRRGRSRASTASSQQFLVENVAARSLQDIADDDPLPDDEKTSLTAPPLIDHPALHPLPGEHPAIPTYHPGQGISFPELAQQPRHVAGHPYSLYEQSKERESTSDRQPTSPTPCATFPFQNLEISSQNAIIGAKYYIPGISSKKLSSPHPAAAVLPPTHVRTSTLRQDHVDRRSPQQIINAARLKDHRRSDSPVLGRPEHHGAVLQGRIATSPDGELHQRKIPSVIPAEPLPQICEAPSNIQSNLPVKTGIGLQSTQYYSPPTSNQWSNIQLAHPSHIDPPVELVGDSTFPKHELGVKPHVSRMLLLSKATSTPNEQPSLHERRKFSSSQRPSIDPTLTTKRSRSAILRFQRGMKSNSDLGTGNEQDIPITQRVRSHPQASHQHSNQDVEGDSEYHKASPAHSDRWSGSTALQSAPSSPVDTLNASQSCYSQDVDGNRYSQVDPGIDRELSELSAAQEKIGRSGEGKSSSELTPRGKSYMRTVPFV